MIKHTEEPMSREDVNKLIDYVNELTRLHNEMYSLINNILDNAIVDETL